MKSGLIQEMYVEVGRTGHADAVDVGVGEAKSIALRSLSVMGRCMVPLAKVKCMLLYVY